LKIIKEKLNKQELTFLTGLRRVGKTTLLKLTIKALIDKGVPSNRIFYISLDDYSIKEKSHIRQILNNN